MNKLLKLLTILFLLLAVATIAIYFLYPEHRDWFYYCGGAAIFTRFVYYIIKHFA